MNETTMIINPCKEKGDPELPIAGMLLVNPVEAQAGHRLAEKRNGRQYFFFNSRLTVIPAGPGTESFFMSGPAVGAPMAVLALEKLVALGAQRIIVYGWCGALHESLRIGDVLLPTWAHSNEGTSAHYPITSRAASHAATRQRLADSLNEKGLKVHIGPVWTTDAPYRESVTQVCKLGNEGILGVDMEYAALVAAAAFREVQLNAVLLVSDELWTGRWNSGFKDKGFKRKSGDLLHFLADFCAGLFHGI